MKTTTKNRIISGILTFIPAAAIMLVFGYPITIGIINAGSIAGCVAAVLIILLWIRFPAISRSDKRVTLFFISMIVAGACLIYAGFLSVLMVNTAMRKPADETGEKRTVIVLGCRLEDGGPSAMLESRLQAALEYLLEDKDAVCVVTGGRGVGESRTEAEVMMRWLVDNGISEDRVYQETESLSTEENLRFAYDVIIYYDLPVHVVLVSDGFHLYRAQMMAHEYFNDIEVLAAKTELAVLPAYWVREWFAISREYALALINY